MTGLAGKQARKLSISVPLTSHKKRAISEWGIKGAKEAICFLQKERGHKGVKWAIKGI